MIDGVDDNGIAMIARVERRGLSQFEAAVDFAGSSQNIIKRILITAGWTVLIGIIGIFILAILDTIIF